MSRSTFNKLKIPKSCFFFVIYSLIQSSVDTHGLTLGMDGKDKTAVGFMEITVIES